MLVAKSLVLIVWRKLKLRNPLWVLFTLGLAMSGLGNLYNTGSHLLHILIFRRPGVMFKHEVKFRVGPTKVVVISGTAVVVYTSALRRTLIWSTNNKTTVDLNSVRLW